MEETKKTLIFAGVAVVLAILAIIAAPGKFTPEAFVDQGEAFFPEFIDPNEAVTLEVIDFDEATGSAYPFKVTFENGLWVIPSHHNHPADAADRLAQTAAGLIGIKRDDFRTDNVADHGACGVVDPLDEAFTGLSGRGKRVTIKGANGTELADFIVGNDVPGRPGLKFVRVPDQKRVYAARIDVDISTRFQDWIDTDLLQVDKASVNRVTVNDYTINERTGSVNQKDRLELSRGESEWTARGMKKNKIIDSTAMDEFLTAIDELAIVGVRVKPASLAEGLQFKSAEGTELSLSEMQSLQSKGFYLTRDGQLMSNEGELKVQASDGVIYTLRFGEILFGSGLAVSAGTSDQEQAGPAENRYLLISTDFDQRLFPEPKLPTDSSFMGKPDSLKTEADRANEGLMGQHKRWHYQVSAGSGRSDELNARFAGWYYVISSESFDKLHVGRTKLVVDRQ